MGLRTQKMGLRTRKVRFQNSPSEFSKPAEWVLKNSLSEFSEPAEWVLKTQNDGTEEGSNYAPRAKKIGRASCRERV